MPRKKQEREEFKVKKISPFDIINYMFTNDAEFDKLSDMILDQNFFIINRTFSIKYPLQAQVFNLLGISAADVIKSWKVFLNAKEKSGKAPYWCYTKGTKRAQEQKDTSVEVKSSDIKNIAEYYGMSIQDIRVMADLFPEETLKESDRINKLYSVREQEKQISKIK